MSETPPPIKVHHHNPYLISFFAGREQAGRHAEEHNWVDDSAIKLGTAMYAIHSGVEAVVYDTFTSVPHAEFVRGYLEKMGIRKFTVVLSHWHLDHIVRQCRVRRLRYHRHIAHARCAGQAQGRHRGGQGVGTTGHRAARIPEHHVR